MVRWLVVVCFGVIVDIVVNVVVDFFFVSCGIELEIVKVVEEIEILFDLVVLVVIMVYLIVMKFFVRDDDW